ncbi:MAG TPA: hypothetical protein VMD92_10990 [Acidobacteriaceae bacterium]|nr:hypothetical protein [Acidobacteriaceae bacterium]
MLLTVAAVASAAATGFGVAAWRGAAPGTEHSRLFTAFCVFPVLGLIAFLAYFVMPRVSLIVAWVILTGSFLTAYLVPLEACARHACSMQDSLRIGWATLTGAHEVWMLAVAALCLLLDYTRPGPVAAPAIVPEGADQDLRT